MRNDSSGLSFNAALWSGALLIALVAGCATAPKIDWASRIGTYTYDQAILELGPPDRHAKLSDGTVVAEWITHRGGYSHTYVSGFYGYGYPYGYYYPSHVYTTPPSPSYFVRLTFGPDGRLTDWKRVRK